MKMISTLIKYWYLILILILALITAGQYKKISNMNTEISNLERNYTALQTDYDTIRNTCNQYKIANSELILTKDSLIKEMSKYAEKGVSQVTYVAKHIKVRDTIIIPELIECQINIDTCIADAYRKCCIMIQDTNVSVSTEVFSNGYMTRKLTYLYPEGRRRWFAPWTWRRRKVPTYEVTWHESNPYINIDNVKSIEISEE